MKKILWVEDEATAQYLGDLKLKLPDVEILQVGNGTEALKKFREFKDDILVVLVDLYIPKGTSATLKNSQHGPPGLNVAELIRAENRVLPILALTGQDHEEVARRWFRANSQDWEGGEGWYLKHAHEPRLLIDRIARRFHAGEPRGDKKAVLIVHGRDLVTLELVNKFAEDKLGLKPRVFAREPSGSIANINKFEELVDSADFAFVLMTPDDFGFPKQDPSQIRHRARQNVILELGYLFGKWGRDSRRIVIFERKLPHAHADIEIPSDILAITLFRIEGDEISATLEQRVREHLQRWIGTTGSDLRLMCPVNDAGDIPNEGKNSVVVAAVHDVLHFRIFDVDGKVIASTDEKKLAGQAQKIEVLRKQLEGLWPPHELARSDKDQIIAAVTSIVSHGQAP